MKLAGSKKGGLEVKSTNKCFFFSKLFFCCGDAKTKVGSKKARTKLSNILVQSRDPDKINGVKSCNNSCLPTKRKSRVAELEPPTKTLQKKQQTLKESQMRRESLQVKLIPSALKRHSKNSGSSTKNTNKVESNRFNSPYMQKVVSRGLNSMNSFAHNEAGEVVAYEYMANNGEENSNRSEGVHSGTIEGTNNLDVIQKQSSAPISYISTQNHSSFQDNLLMPAGIQGIKEDEMEDTLRSASPNLDLRSHESKALQWRTQKDISIDEYKELSEAYSDHEEIEAMEGYITSMKRAMSENNVKPMNTTRRSSKFKQLFNSNNGEDDGSVSDSQSECESIENNVLSLPAGGERSTILTHQLQPPSNLDEDEFLGYQHEALNNDEKSRKGGTRKAISPKRKNFSTVKTNSCVDIDTVDGKTIIKRVTEVEKKNIIKNRLKKFLL